LFLLCLDLDEEEDEEEEEFLLLLSLLPSINLKYFLFGLGVLDLEQSFLIWPFLKHL